MLYSVSMKHEKSEMRRKRIIFESIRTAVATLVLLAVSLLTFAWFHHARPIRRYRCAGCHAGAYAGIRPLDR